VHAVARDGRTLAGRSFGPDGGLAVLFIAGAGTGSSMSFGGRILADAGVRLLTMDRPGMGGSAVDPGRTLASTATDYRDFVAAATGGGADGIAVVANSQGSVFGLAAAAAGWVSRLVLASPQDEVAHPAIAAMLPAEQTQLPRLAATDPDEAGRVLSGFTAGAMEELVLGWAGDADRAVYSEPGFLTTYRRALAEGFANDGAGYVRDTLLAMRPWELDLAAIGTPVEVLFGAHDAGHSPDHGATLAGRIPGARREVLPDGGGALLWTHADLVLQRALA
jgi:pimeloyl-ACP methyl ester carboxylesterase